MSLHAAGKSLLAFALAFAQGGDPNASNLLFVVVIFSIVLVTAVAAIIPVNFARWRKSRYADLIIAITILWGLLTAGISIWAFLSQHQWSVEYATRVESGYYDPNDLSDAPRLPWIWWAVMAVVYVGLIVFSRKRPAVKPVKAGFEVLVTSSPPDSDAKQ